SPAARDGRGQAGGPPRSGRRRARARARASARRRGGAPRRSAAPSAAAGGGVVLVGGRRKVPEGVAAEDGANRPGEPGVGDLGGEEVEEALELVAIASGV